MSADMLEWRALTARAAFASHRLVGWIFWDPQAIANHAALGVERGVGYYIASRAGGLADAGADVVTAAFHTIHPDFVRVSVELALAAATTEQVQAARDAAVGAGLAEYVPEICDDLAAMGPALWDVVDHLPVAGRPLFAALRSRRRSDDSLVSAWLAVNTIREWRGDTHFALVVADDLSPVAAGLLDGAWRGHDDDWLPRSRGADDAGLTAALAELTARGLASDGRVNTAGVAHRQALEDRLDDLCAPGWQHLGRDTTTRFCDLIEPVGERLLARIDATAGPRWMPAARTRTASAT
ncbi:MAG: hypothetical protein RLZZ01_110 [Actinomycetota bacterium]